ncbi:hypothetical protein JHK85_005179 [Glycine max]|nr:hypothetical protein JHK87_004840 [Glycine soja]KAG5063996.1 hypothetical protein JHK85_005179 [Glycine max]KAG5080950.1 hypothetical protein JHK86_005015 [Glycine max]
MMHKGNNTRSRTVAKGICAGSSKNYYKGLVQVKNPTARIEHMHDTTTSKLGQDQLFYFQQRGIDSEAGLTAVIKGFCHAVLDELHNKLKSEAAEIVKSKLVWSVG